MSDNDNLVDAIEIAQEAETTDTPTGDWSIKTSSGETVKLDDGLESNSF